MLLSVLLGNSPVLSMRRVATDPSRATSFTTLEHVIV
jgi:hypothetical protein